MDKKPNNFASVILWLVYAAGAVSAGWAVGIGWKDGKGRWIDLPCAMVWPVCIAWVEVPKYIEGRQNKDLQKPEQK